MSSGEIEVIPGRVFAEEELVDPAKLNQLGTPTLRIKEQAVTSRELADGTITSDKLSVDLEAQLSVANNSITTLKIVDGAVTTSKLNDSAVTAAKMGTGVVQTKYARRSDTINITATGGILISQGTEIFSLSITPLLASSLIVLEAHFVFITNPQSSIYCSFFRNAASNAVSASAISSAAALAFLQCDAIGSDLPVSTSAQTYSVRVGPTAASTLSINTAPGGSNLFSGVCWAHFFIHEMQIAP